MAIVSIMRDWGMDPSIVRIVSTNSLTEISETNYLYDQRFLIQDINGGTFQWSLTDMVLVYASDGWGLFTIDPSFNTLDVFFIPGTTGENTYIPISGTSKTIIPNENYIALNGSLTTFNLPAIFPVGSYTEIVGFGVGGWKIQQTTAGHIIHLASTDTTLGLSGSLASTQRYQSAKVVCVIQNEQFIAISGSASELELS